MMADLETTTETGAEGVAPASAELTVPHEYGDRGMESWEGSLEASGIDGTGYRNHELREFRATHEGEFIEPLSRSYPVERFDDPERVVRTINPRFEDPSGRYDVNCADCARAVERTWRGCHEEAAGRLAQFDEGGNPYDGEFPEETEEWAAETFSSVPNPEALRARLEQGGHGSSAIVHTQFSIDGEVGAHAYNVVNHHGEVRVLDGQTGETFAWESNRIYDLGDDQSHIALGWDARGERLSW